MKINKIRPIPKPLLKKIQKIDKSRYPIQDGHTRFYSYLTRNDGELCKVTVAVRNKREKWYCKQCAVHGIHSEMCFVKDMAFTYIAGYTVGWHEEGLTSQAKWYEYGDWGYIEDRYFDVYAPVVNMKYLATQDEYKYSAWELLRGDRIIQHLRLYEEFPQLEYVMKAGLDCFATSKQILRLIGKDKGFAKWLIVNKQKFMHKFYYKDIVVKAFKTGQDLDALQADKELLLHYAHEEGYKWAKEKLPEDKQKKLVRYLHSKRIYSSSYQDYIRACIYLKLDLTEDKNAFPHDFTYWHDTRIDEYRTAKALAEEKAKKELLAKFKAVAEKYMPLQHSKADYVVVIAMSPSELSYEGQMLHHCVGSMGYDQKFMREESLIFFVRHKEEPDTPFVTVEYSPSKHKILQTHGMHNSTPDEQTMKYIQKTWLPFANKAVRQMAVA